MKYKVKVPVINYHETEITNTQVVEILRQKQKSLLSGWDSLLKKNDGSYRYYNHGYGSHDIGEEEGGIVSEDVVNAYNVISETIMLFNT